MNNPIILEECFEKVIFTRGIHNKLGVPQKKVSSLRIHHKNRGVSVKKMREILILAGYQLVQQETWQLPTVPESI